MVFSAFLKASLAMDISFRYTPSASRFLFATSATSTALEMNLPRDLMITSGEFFIIS